MFVAGHIVFCPQQCTGVAEEEIQAREFTPSSSLQEKERGRKEMYPMRFNLTHL
jgi:hypothetical protein